MKTKKVNKFKVFVIAVISLGVLGIGSFLFLLYSPYDVFRNWLITTAMTTMSHQYLATWFYSDETINEVLANNYVAVADENTDIDSITFVDYDSSVMT